MTQGVDQAQKALEVLGRCLASRTERINKLEVENARLRLTVSESADHLGSLKATLSSALNEGESE